MTKKKLTPQEEKFAQYVGRGDNYTDAHKKSYIQRTDRKNKSVWEMASAVASRPHVQARIEQIRSEVHKRNHATIDEVLSQLADWLRFDPLDLMDENDCVKSLSEMDKKARMSLAEITVSEIWGSDPDGVRKGKVKIGELKKIKFIDKRAVSDQFMKKFGQYATNLKIDDESLEYLEDLLKQIKE